MNKLILVALLLCIAMPIMAQELTVEEPELISEEEVGMLPDSPFYFFKNFSRGFQLFFTFDNVKKAELRQRFSNEQLLEFEKLSEKEGVKAKLLERVRASYEKQQEKLYQLIEKIKDSDKIEAFKEKYFNQQVLHDEILRKLEGKVPADVWDKIEQNRDNHVQRFGEVMFKLEEMEDVPLRLENALRQGAEDVRGLELLQRIQNQVQNSEQLQQLQRVESQIMNRVQNTLEGTTTQVQERVRNYLEQDSEDSVEQEVINKIRNAIQGSTSVQNKGTETGKGNK